MWRIRGITGYVPRLFKFQRRMMSRGELKFRVPWGEVSAVTWGNPREKPVLLVHGTLDNADSFKRLIRLLPETFYYVCIDLPGHGLSSHFPRGMNLDFHNFVLTIHYILNELNWKNCLYVGHSFGGILGGMYAVLFPGRLERIIALDALMCIPYSPQEVLARLKVIQEATLLSLAKEERKLYSKEEALDAIQNKRPFLINKEAAEALFERAVTRIDDKYRFNRDPRLKTVIGFYLDEEHNIEFLKHLKTPTLLLVPRESYFQFVGRMHLVEIWGRKFPEFVKVINVDGNHDVHNDNPGIVAPLFEKFFNFPESKL